MSDSVTLWTVVRLLCPWDSPGKNTGADCHALLQGIFLTQGSKLCVLCLLLWPVFSPEDRAQVSHSEGGFFTVWAIGKPPGLAGGFFTTSTTWETPDLSVNQGFLYPSLLPAPKPQPSAMLYSTGQDPARKMEHLERYKVLQMDGI